jgi:DNA mismatch repair ATPase MutS
MSATRILKRRRDALNVLDDDVFNNKKHCLLIHYSCESFYDRPDGSSPRITSIAVRNFSSGQTKSFSIHQFAEIKRISPSDININYDACEKEMLESFYSFVNKNINSTWIHWNMRDSNYGFEAIAHRYRVLGGDPIQIESVNLVDLASLLIDIYTTKYVEHPRLAKLIEMNKITAINFLNGASEAKAFDDGEYVKLHQSTLRKVDIFSNILGKIEDGSLRVNSDCFNLYKLYPQIWVEKIQTHWGYALFSIIASIVGFWVFLFNAAPK